MFQVGSQRGSPTCGKCDGKPHLHCKRYRRGRGYKALRLTYVGGGAKEDQDKLKVSRPDGNTAKVLLGK